MDYTVEFSIEYIKEKTQSLYICAGGFEDRSIAIVKNLVDFGDKIFNYSLILEYSIHKKENEPNLDFLGNNLPKISQHMLENSVVDIENVFQTKVSFIERLSEISLEEISTIFLDISGMANSLILLTLYELDKIFPYKDKIILYAEADTYYPTKDEKDEILELMKSDNEEDILQLGEKLGASGAREVVIFPDFKGRFDTNLPICLIFFIGYEPSRAAGLLDAYRPNLIIACFGDSPHEKYEWRTKFSNELNKNLFDNFEHVDKCISTFDIPKIIRDLDQIYRSANNEKILYEHYNIAITPQCSKLQTVAIYLFSQIHPDVQVVFCFPGKFNPERYSKGIGKLWICDLQKIKHIRHVS